MIADDFTNLAPTPSEDLAVTGTTSEPIVALTTCGSRVFVATEFHVYELVDGIWHPMVFANG